MLIVTNGLIDSGEGMLLHPELEPWQRALTGMAPVWFDCPAMHPLEWLAKLQGCKPAALLASASDALPEDVSQCWVASPFHAMVARDQVRVMPEALLPWSAEDAAWLQELLNPLLLEEGMQLHCIDRALLLTCRDRFNASPLSFAHISGSTLPNSHPPGPDGGRLMRLQAEMQMLLHGHPNQRRQQNGAPAIHGLWLWGGCDYPCQLETTLPAVATRNALLQSLVDGRDAKLTISEAESLPELINPHVSLPEQVLLAGSRHAVLLGRSWRPRFGKGKWQPKSAKSESRLLAALTTIMQAGER